MKLFAREILLELVEKTKQLYMLPALAYCYFVTSFDLWMSKGPSKTNSLVINFGGVDWQLKHIAIGFFEAFDTFGHALAKDLIDLLNKYDLRKQIIAYVKDEGTNSNTMTIALKSIVSYDILSLIESFQGSFFGHTFFKACQYALINDFFCNGLKYIFVKTTHMTYKNA
jgi:hypothetical protein